MLLFFLNASKYCIRLKTKRGSTPLTTAGCLKKTLLLKQVEGEETAVVTSVYLFLIVFSKFVTRNIFLQFKNVMFSL